jgi:hypothetical protein
MKRSRIAPHAPPPPASGLWPHVLQWMVAAMLPDDSSLAFAASLLAQSINRPGLTPKQVRYAERLRGEMLDEWDATQATAPRPAPADLAAMTPRGQA